MDTNLGLIMDETTSNNIKLYDNYCKKVLKDPQMLSRILKYVVRETKSYSLEEIESFITNTEVDVEFEPGRFNSVDTLESESSYKDEGVLKFDVFLKVDIPKKESVRVYLDIEAQNEKNLKYDIVTRGIVYVSRIISRQYKQEYDSKDYSGLKKVYSIWIVPLAPKYMDGLVRRYTLKEDIVSTQVNIKKPLQKYDKIEIVEIYTSKAHDIDSRYEVLDELLSPISLLLTNIISDSNKKKEIASKRYGMRIEYEREDKPMCNLGEAIYFDGVEKGIEQGKIGLLISLVKDHEITIQQAAKRLNISVDEFEKLMKQ